MTPTSEPPEKKPVDYAALSTQALTVGGEVGCLTLIIVMISVFGGLWLDNLFGTKPLLTVFLVLASAPVALGLTVWVAKRAVENANRSSAFGKEPKTTMKGDKTGE